MSSSQVETEETKVSSKEEAKTEQEEEKVQQPQEEEKTVATNYHYSSYNRFINPYGEEEEEDENKPRLSRRYIDKLLCSDFKQYYRTHELNEILYLHFKGFEKIENLQTFTNLKVLYMEGNAIKKIEGLETLVNITSLYLHQNVIEKIEGLDTLVNLYNLNLSDNLISKIENLRGCTKLSNLLLKRNRIGFNGIEDIKGILELNKDFSVLDISDNHIKEVEIVDDYLAKIPNLRVIYLNGNECVRKISNYRKTLISKLKDIRYIDDRPVFEDEKRFALAFARGGLEEERKERALYRKEQQEKEDKRIRDFQEMVSKWKGEKNEESNQEVEEVKKETEEEREKKKLELLRRIKEKDKKKNEIFDEEDIGNMPHLKKDDNNPALAPTTENNNNNSNDDDVPALEEVKKNNDTTNTEKEDNIEKDSNKEQPSNKEEIINTSIPQDNQKEKEDDTNKGVKIPIRELDELD